MNTAKCCYSETLQINYLMLRIFLVVIKLNCWFTNKTKNNKSLKSWTTLQILKKDFNFIYLDAFITKKY